MRKQAEWAEETNDLSAAYQTYISAGELLKAIAILGEKNWIDKLVEVARGLASSQVRVASRPRRAASMFNIFSWGSHARGVFLPVVLFFDSQVAELRGMYADTYGRHDQAAYAKDHDIVQFFRSLHSDAQKYIREHYFTDVAS